MTTERSEPTLSETFAQPDGVALTADCYEPAADDRNGAAVIFVHGGGWNAGSRHQFLWHAWQLSLHGYFTCTIDYRLSTVAPFPAAMEDCQEAVRWVRRQAERCAVDPGRIGAFGSSAGGHLVACLGVMEDQVDGVSARVNCVVDVHGVHDFISLVDEFGEVQESSEAFFGGPMTAETRDLWEAASPARHVTAEAAPMLLTHDPGEATVPFRQTRLLAEALMAAGRPVQFMPTPGSGHGFVYGPENGWTQQVWPVARAWFDHHLQA